MGTLFKGNVHIRRDLEKRLVAASGAGDASTVRKLMRKKVSTSVTDEYGRTALSLASSGGHSEVVNILLEADADVNQKLGSGVTALHMAAKNHQNTVKHLVLAGAQLQAKTCSGITPTDLCRHGSDTWIVLSNARKGIMPQNEVEPEVPDIPTYSLPKVTTENKKSGKKGKNGKKGKGKKSGKKSGKRKGKKKKK